MSNSGAAGSREIKKVMRTALIGIKPADLIMLKGYLRVLLRLEADLEWVPASHPNVDLYIINDEFRGSTSVHKILKGQPKNKVLYVRRSDNAEGMMSENLIILPLQDLKALSNWLYGNLPFLQADDTPTTTIPETSQPSSSDTIKSNQTRNKQTTNANTINTSSTSSGNQADTDENGLLSVIETIQARPDGLYELTCDQGQIALVNLVRQRIWVAGEGNVTPNNSWKLQQTTRAVTPDITKSVDLFQWLWQQAWNTPDNLLSMISDEQAYQLRYWPKPRMTTNRKELTHLLTAMESQPILVRDLAVKADTSVNSAKKVVASLLLAGGLYDDTYDELKKNGISSVNSNTNSSNAVTSSHTSTGDTETDSMAQSVASPTTEPVKHKRSLLDDILARRSSGEAPTSAKSTSQSGADNTNDNSVKEEKLGFLAKIRRKLGL